MTDPYFSANQTAIALLTQRMEKLEAENEKLRAALKPFAANVDQPTRIYEHEGVRMVLVDQDVLLRLCRTAAAALENNNV